MIRTIHNKNPNSISKVKRAKVLSPESEIMQAKWIDFLNNNDNIPSYYPYNLTICDDPKFIWFRNAKVGTRSIFNALDNAKVKYTAEHALNCHYSPQKYKDYYKFAFIRNPWDRLVSGWRQKVFVPAWSHKKTVRKTILGIPPSDYIQMQKFENFISFCSTIDIKNCDSHFRLQCALIDLNEVDHIGKFENFDVDVKEIFKFLDLPINQVPHKNKSKRRPSYKSYYTEETMQQVAKIYQKDIQVFGYTF